MGIKFTGDAMTCALSGHNARLGDEGAWSVSWLPGRTFGRNEAITALSIAEAAAQIADDAGTYDRLWPHIAGWAAELGLGAVDALDAAAQGPGDDEGLSYCPDCGESGPSCQCESGEDVTDYIADDEAGPTAAVWRVQAGEGTAVGPSVPVTASLCHGGWHLVPHQAAFARSEVAWLGSDNAGQSPE
jgi:hypothetical protein